MAKREKQKRLEDWDGHIKKELEMAKNKADNQLKALEKN
mgnify:CR=1 FL=1